jgi:hypothetical protein
LLGALGAEKIIGWVVAAGCDCPALPPQAARTAVSAIPTTAITNVRFPTSSLRARPSRLSTTGTGCIDRSCGDAALQGSIAA